MAIVNTHNDFGKIHSLFPKSMLKGPSNFDLPPGGCMGTKWSRGNGKSRAVLSSITGVNCFDLEPGHIPEVSIPTKEEPKSLNEELEELLVKKKRAY